MDPSSKRHDVVAHCQRCGRSLALQVAFGRPRPVCPGCGFVHFQPTANAGVAVVVHARRVLLVQRAIGPYRGAWGFPGGFQEYGESLAETAIRETLEEAGLRVRVERILEVAHTRDDPRKLVNVALFLARPEQDVDTSVAAALCPSDDAADARFFAWHEVPADVAFESSRALLQRLATEFPDGDVR